VLQRDEVQVFTALRVGLPGGPRRQEVVSQAEPGFQDAEVAPALPALGQPVAREKHMRGLRLRACGRVVDVIMVQRTRHRTSEVDACRAQ
jgi:hypothetical protein